MLARKAIRFISVNVTLEGMASLTPGFDIFINNRDIEMCTVCVHSWYFRKRQKFTKQKGFFVVVQFVSLQWRYSH